MKTLLDQQIYQQKWENEKTYSYNPTSNKKTFVIDTPPPTVSGALHIGHVFSYTQTDILARYQRMQGKNVFYSMGYDNNGLPTERRVQNLYKIFCDPSMDPLQEPLFEEIENRKHKKKLSPLLAITKKTFVKLCISQSQEDQKQYKQLWCNMGLSVDWSQSYETLSPTSQVISQKSFLDLYQKGLIENRNTPVFWDTQFKTAVAQADIEDKKKQGFFYNIKFKVYNASDEFIIATTRPELLPACIAIAAHPEDKRYTQWIGKQAVSPLFSAVVPIISSRHADPNKGTGILMICSFGDREDVQFWEKHKLPLKQIIGADGFLKDILFIKTQTNNIQSGVINNFLSLYPKEAQKYYSLLKGLRINKAQQKIVELLTQQNYLVGSKKPTEQSVKFYEKGDFPLELIPTRQWYIKILDHKKELLQQGKKINWYPLSMFKRYEQWVEGLNQDWCISRQRFVGVPFPIWYGLDKNKVPDYKNPLLPSESFLLKTQNLKTPVNPLSSAPAQWNTKWKHYTEETRGKPEGFIADTAVMDTWATSSLTPQINAQWGLDNKRYNKLFPADLRPQAHEIIRTWAFYTIVKSYFHADKSEALNTNIPWKNIAISGWVMNPQKLKISKSKSGNTVSPEDLITQYSADAIRYWAAKVRLGVDTIFDENMFKTGRKLTVKLNNAFKFIQIFTPYLIQKNNNKQVTDPFKGVENSLSYIKNKVDYAWIMHLLNTHKQVTGLLNEFKYAQAFDQIEKSFWIFCDNYLELVKGRAYQITHEDSDLKKQNLSAILSAIYALDLSIYIMIKWLAPYLPYITEHIWSQRYGYSTEETSSVHNSNWSFESALLKQNNLEEEKLLEFSFNVLKQIRNIKSAQSKSLSTPVKQLTIISKKQNKSMFNECVEDIARSAFVKLEDIVFKEDTQKTEEIKIELSL